MNLFRATKVSQVFNPVAQVFNPVSQVFNPVAQVFNPVAQVLNPVAQVFNLLYRRFSTCWPMQRMRASVPVQIFPLPTQRDSIAGLASDRLQVKNLRYSRLKVCATQKVCATSLLLLLCFACEPLLAQFTPGQGFGGFGGQNAASRSRSNRQYPNNQVGDAVISIDPETRSLVVVADEDTAAYISQVVSNLDRPKPQVLIKVVFLEVTHSDALDLGVEGSYNKDLGIGKQFISGFTTNFGVISNTIVPTSITPNTSGTTFMGSNIFGLTPLGAGSTAGLYQLFAADYTVTLKAIAQTGKARVLSRPSVVARNNQPATITVGQSVPLITDVRFDNFGNAINSVNYQSVGIILRVTPFITSDGNVEMILSPETSELVADRSQWVPITTGVSAPLINSRSADTVVVTPDGQTVIIGGLMANSKADSVTKIPFLGDIPLLGNLFRHTVKNTVNNELVIFLTPHIIMAPSEMAALSSGERAKSDASKSLTEKELNQFLDELPVTPMTNSPPTKKKKK